MASRSISKFRLLLNAIGCACLIIWALLVFLEGMRHPGGLVHPVIGEPDRDKGAVVSIFGLSFFLVLGLMALLSLIRTARKWRAKDSDNCL